MSPKKLNPDHSHPALPLKEPKKCPGSLVKLSEGQFSEVVQERLASRAVIPGKTSKNVASRSDSKLNGKLGRKGIEHIPASKPAVLMKVLLLLKSDVASAK